MQAWARRRIWYAERSCCAQVSLENGNFHLVYFIFRRQIERSGARGTTLSNLTLVSLTSCLPSLMLLYLSLAATAAEK